MDEKNRDGKQSVEYRGKSVDDALRLAAEEVGVPHEQLNYEVLRDTSRSIFGLVHTGEAVVRIWLPAQVAEEREPAPEPEPEAPVEREPQRPAPSPPDAERNPPELATIASEVVSTMLDKMGVLAAVEVASPGGEVDPVTNDVSPLSLNLVGDDLGILIGRRGETLRDLEFLVRLITSRQLGTWPNLVLDVEGYKEKRANTLRSLAKRMADQVRQTGQPVVLEPMSAYERRIIHIALRDEPDVYTESTGEGDARKVQIIPR